MSHQTTTAAQGTSLDKLMSNAEADCLAFAVRYALGRPDTTAPLIVAREVVRRWVELDEWHRTQLHKEILATPTRPKIWQRVLDMDIELPF